MAMSVFLRNGARSSVVLPNLFKNQSLVTRLAGQYSPLQQALKKETTLVQRVKDVCIKSPNKKNMSMMSAPKHWTIERGLSIALYAFIPTAIALPGNSMFDDIAIIGMLLHSHWGLESIVVDYVRPILFGHVIPKIALVALHLVTIFAMGSLLYFNHNDIGFGQAVRNLWTLEPKGTKQQQQVAA